MGLSPKICYVLFIVSRKQSSHKNLIFQFGNTTYQTIAFLAPNKPDSTFNLVMTLVMPHQPAIGSPFFSCLLV